MFQDDSSQLVISSLCACAHSLNRRQTGGLILTLARSRRAQVQARLGRALVRADCEEQDTGDQLDGDSLQFHAFALLNLVAVKASSKSLWCSIRVWSCNRCFVYLAALIGPILSTAAGWRINFNLLAALLSRASSRANSSLPISQPTSQPVNQNRTCRETETNSPTIDCSPVEFYCLFGARTQLEALFHLLETNRL